MMGSPSILCIGSVLWDVIGRSASTMRVGSDVPGRITRLPGGVALNIAMTLRKFDLSPALLSVIGDDVAGHELFDRCKAMGLNVDYVYRSTDLPTDLYMAVEGQNGLIAAIADAHSLEQAGDKILTALTDGTLGSAASPYNGVIALDGNLTEQLLRDIVLMDEFQTADLRVAPASPGKAERLVPLLEHSGVTLYVNLEEAGLICHQKFETSEHAAKGLLSKGAKRVLVTNGGHSTCDALEAEIITLTPPEVLVSRVTGAGDTFMAAHIAAEMRGLDRKQALQAALDAAATYVSGDIGA